MTLYPLVEIILYLALSLAPVNAVGVTVTGPNLSIGFTRETSGWTADEEYYSAANEKLYRGPKDNRTAIDLREHVKGVKRHDWNSAPFSPHEATTVEKTAVGYKVRAKVSDESEQVYTITYYKLSTTGKTDISPKEGPTIQIHVLGTVRSPGAYTVPKDALLLDAIAAAGGFGRLALPGQVKLFRSSEEAPPTLTIHNTPPMMTGKAEPVVLHDGDRIFVPEIFF